MQIVEQVDAARVAQTDLLLTGSKSAGFEDMALAGAGLAGDDDIVAPANEVEAGELEDEVFVERLAHESAATAALTRRRRGSRKRRRVDQSVGAAEAVTSYFRKPLTGSVMAPSAGATLGRSCRDTHATRCLYGLRST